MIKFYFTLICICLAYGRLAAQFSFYTQRPEFLKANSHWFFYNSSGTPGTSGINFNTNPATPLSAELASGNYTSVSDTATGALLFYTNGDICWDRNFAVMPNGNNLAERARSTAATNQGACVVPFIGDSSRYYVFSLQSRVTTPRLYYSIVDMRLNGGFGAVEANNKAILLSDSARPMGTHMIAVPGNNCDVWLLVHPSFDTVIHAYHITKDGLDTNPVVSSPGGGALGTYPVFERGSMAISPDRKLLSITSYTPSALSAPGQFNGSVGVILAQFDPATGRVANGISVDTKVAPYSGCFSPDNSKLYIQGLIDSFTNDGGGITKVMQYDVSQYDQAAIAASKTPIYTFPLGTQYCGLRRWRDTILIMPYTNKQTNLQYIAQPNSAGALCNYQTGSYIPLLNPNYNNNNFGNDVVYPLPPDTVAGIALDTLICEELTADLQLEVEMTADFYYWSEGSRSKSIPVKGDGKYWVLYGDSCHYRVDTFVVKIPGLFTTISVDGFRLGVTGGPFATYQWYLDGAAMEGATDSVLIVTGNGLYSVAVSDGSGCTFLSDPYRVDNYTKVNFFGNHNIQVYPNPVDNLLYVESAIPVNASVFSMEGRQIAIVNNVHTLSVASWSKGLYWVYVIDKSGAVVKVEKLVKQ